MGVHSDNARERVLDAFEDALIAAGDAASSLEAVAGRAGLTKGGLLYHFRSRAALVTGLIERFRDRTRTDLEVMAHAPEGAAVNYLRVADYLASPLHKTTLALTQLTDREPSAGAALAQARSRESALIVADLDDPLRAEVTTLFADGLYARAITRGESGADQQAVIEWFVAHVLHAPDARPSADQLHPNQAEASEG